MSVFFVDNRSDDVSYFCCSLAFCTFADRAVECHVSCVFAVHNRSVQKFRHGIPGVDAIVLTHDHADAILGLDDVRGLQVWKR